MHAAASASAAPPPPRWEAVLDRDMVAADAAAAAQLTGWKLDDSVVSMKLCPRHRLLAYTLRPLAGPGGAPPQPDTYVALVRDTATGRLLLPGGVLRGVCGVELAADGRHVAATHPDAHGRPCKAVLYDLTCSSRPVVLLEEADPRFFLSLGRTKDWRFLLLSSNSKTSSEVHLLDAQSPASSPPLLVQRRRPGLEYFVEHWAPPEGSGGDPAPGEGAVAGARAHTTTRAVGTGGAVPNRNSPRDAAPATAAPAGAVGSSAGPSPSYLVILTNMGAVPDTACVSSGLPGVSVDGGSSGSQGLSLIHI